MAAALALALLAAPSPRPFLDGVGERSLWAGLQQRFLPSDKWFGIISPREIVGRARPHEGASITTGSLPRTEVPAATPATGSESR
jgi:hypothetical protein